MSKNTPSVKQLESKGNKKVFIGVGIAVVVVVAIVTAAILLLPKKQETAKDKSYDEVNKQVQATDGERNYKGQAESYKQYIEANPNSQDVPKAMLKAAAASVNAGDYPAAISYYEEAAKADPEKKLASLHGIANVYIIQGNKEKAIEYLRMAIAEMKASGNEGMELQINSDEAAIRGLEGN